MENIDRQKKNRAVLKDAAAISFNVLAKMRQDEFVSMESLHKSCRHYLAILVRFWSSQTENIPKINSDYLIVIMSVEMERDIYVASTFNMCRDCAGAGGQTLGMAMASFVHIALFEFESDYCKVIRENRPEWNVICVDMHDFDGRLDKNIDLFGWRCTLPPFSVSDKQ